MRPFPFAIHRVIQATPELAGQLLAAALLAHMQS
jgi:hypothetical protein